MKRFSWYLISIYMVVFILTLFTPTLGGDMFSFYFFIGICALMIMLIENKINVRAVGFILTLFAMMLIFWDGQAALRINDRHWETQIKIIERQMLEESKMQEKNRDLPETPTNME